ncbi:MAG: MarR family winged helix-turn-helix transcriptional regulator [Janthinobacterium lividum]
MWNYRQIVDNPVILNKIGKNAFQSAEIALMPEIYSVENFEPKRAVGRLLTRARHLLLERVGERLAPLDLTAAQWGVVVSLAEGIASTPAELSRMLDYDPGAMTRLIDRLEKKEVVRRTRSTDDRRSVSLELTERGRLLYPEILPVIVGVYNELLAGFTKEDADQLERLLTRMLDNA